MIRRLLSLLAALLFVVLAIDIVYGFTSISPGSPTKLMVVDVSSAGDLEKFVESGIPAYASLTGQEGDYLIAGAGHYGLSRLQSLQLTHRILEEDIQGKTYFIASPAPNRLTPRWQDFGQLLHDDGIQVLLRMSESDADTLAESGVSLQRLFLDPIVLNPTAASGGIPADIDPDPIIQSMMDQVISSTVYQYDGNLSGEWPVLIGGQPYTIVTRHTESGIPIEKATDYVAEHLTNLGLDVEYHVWNAARPPNIVGEITGETDPDEIFMITAHIDDMPSGPVAPGADDNASGSTGVMIASEIFSQYQWGCTLRFAFFTGEEQGLYGSNAYADRALAVGENIVGVLNLDMIGYNTPDSSRTIDLEGRSSVPGSMEIGYLFADVIDAYAINLIHEVSSGTCCSDHVPFLDNGFAAILAIEDLSDFNPNYHTTSDLLSNLDIDYFTDFVKASIGTYAHMTSCMMGSLDGHVKNAEDNSPIEGAVVHLADASGQEAFASTNSSGYYTVAANVGAYTVTVTAAGFTPASVSDVEILPTGVTQNFDLARAEFLYYFPVTRVLE